VDANYFKSFVLFIVTSQTTDMRFSFVSLFHCIDLFSFTTDKACSQMHLLPKKPAQTDAFRLIFRICLLKNITEVKQIAFFEFRPKFITAE
jgi:hypothetical protein